MHTQQKIKCVLYSVNKLCKMMVIHLYTCSASRLIRTWPLIPIHACNVFNSCRNESLKKINIQRLLTAEKRKFASFCFIYQTISCYMTPPILSYMTPPILSGNKFNNIIFITMWQTQSINAKYKRPNKTSVFFSTEIIFVIVIVSTFRLSFLFNNPQAKLKRIIIICYIFVIRKQ